jgi:hypothetical protein
LCGAPAKLVDTVVDANAVTLAEGTFWFVFDAETPEDCSRRSAARLRDRASWQRVMRQRWAAISAERRGASVRRYTPA